MNKYRFAGACATAIFLLIALLIAGCGDTTAPEPAPPPPPPPPPPDLIATCTEDCTLPIELPDPTGPPRPPGAPTEPYRVAGGVDLNFELVGYTDQRSAVLVVFPEPVLKRAQGEGQDWLYTVRLTRGNNDFEVRSHDDGYCHYPTGCKFVVINVGRPNQPSLINSPTIIIDPQ